MECEYLNNDGKMTVAEITKCNATKRKDVSQASFIPRKSENLNQSSSMFLDFFTSKINECQKTGLSNSETFKTILNLWDDEKSNWILKHSNQNEPKIYIRKYSNLSDFDKFLIEELKIRSEVVSSETINLEQLKEIWKSINKNENIDMKKSTKSEKRDNLISMQLQLDTNLSNNIEIPFTNHLDEIEISPNPSNKLLCKICRKEFDSKHKLKYHEQTTHAQNEYSCHICSHNFTSSSNLKRHLKNVHKIKDFTSPPPTAKDKFKCNQCEYRGRDNHDLKNHERKHTGKKPFSCEKCTFKFSKKSDLNRHILAYCKGTKNKCGKCDKNYFSQKQFYRHCLWSDTCGSLSNAAPISNPDFSVEDESPEIIRLNVGKEGSVVGINCEELININPEYFTKRSKKSRCGVCLGCCSHVDCGNCRTCLLKKTPWKLSRKKRRAVMCIRRQCLKTVAQYDVMKDIRSELLQTTEGLDADNHSNPCQSKSVFDQYSHLPILEDSSASADSIAPTIDNFSAMIPIVDDSGAMVEIPGDDASSNDILQDVFESDVVNEEVISIDLLASTSVDHGGVIVCSNDILFQDRVTIAEGVDHVENESKVYSRVIVMNEEVVQN